MSRLLHPSPGRQRLVQGINSIFKTFRESRDYRMYFGSTVVLNVGFWLQNTAQIWLVLELTHSGTMVGYLAICQFGPIAILGLFGGVVVDRLDNRAVLLFTQSALLFCSAVLALLTLAGNIDTLSIFAVSIIRSLLHCLSNPAYSAFSVALVGKKNLSNAVGLTAAGANFARIFSPALAGLMITMAGAGACFAANAVSYLPMIATLYVIRLDRTDAEGKPETRSAISSLLDGLSRVCSTPKLLILTVALFFITFIPMSFATTLPIFALKTLGRDSTAYGILFSSLGFGSVAGSLVVASFSRQKTGWIFGSAFGLGIAEVLLVSERSLALSSLILIFAGFCMTYFVLGIRICLFTETAQEVHGRIGALYSYIVIGIGPLGSSISGWLSDVGGTELAFSVAGGVAMAVSLLGAIVYRLLRGPEKLPES
jgi:MFS family permease